MLLIDAHLDLAMNAVELNRNLELEVETIRQTEAAMEQKGRGRGTVTLPAMRQGNIGLAVATVISRTARPGSPATGTAAQEISYAKAQGQLAYYRVLESQQKIRLITNLADLQHHLNAWQATSTNQPIGLIISMEGADPIVNPQQVPSWYADGLRIVGLSHYGISAYAHGTGTKGGLTDQGASLLKAMEENGIILDLTHLADQAFWEALDHYSGPVLASHNNCRTLVPGDRQFSDAQLHALIQRGGVIGTALDAWMLYPNWIKEQTPNTVVDLNAVANHIDYICQLAGNANHAAIGSDLDGGYGTEQCPHDLDTIADLQKVALLLDQRGYTKPDIEAVMHGNWIRFFSAAWS